MTSHNAGWRRAAVAVATAVTLALSACGGGGGSDSSVSTGPSAGSPTTLPMPAVLPASINAGGAFTVLDTGGRLLGWGNNVSGEVGDGSTVSRPSPVSVSAITAPVVVVATSVSHSLALTADGKVYAWGHNASGQLGDGTLVDSPTPTPIGDLHDIRGVAAGDGFSMALQADGTVFAWGNNASGQLGDGRAPQDHSTPSVVRGLGAGSGVVEIAAGGSFGVVRKADGSVWEWGNGTSGQLGDGSTDKLSAPTQVKGLGAGSHVVMIAGGGSHVLALKDDGSVLAWGNNESGQLGDGSAPDDRLLPVPVSGFGAGSGVVTVAAGDSFSMAATSDGRVFAWGNNQSGQLGDGAAPTDQTVPELVAGLPPTTGVRSISAGGSHCVAVADDGSVWAWGNNSQGQLGDGNLPNDSYVPVRVPLQD